MPAGREGRVRHACQSVEIFGQKNAGTSALALGLQHTQNVGPMSKALLVLLLAMPGGFFIVPALLLLRRRWAKRLQPTTATVDVPA